MISIAALKFRKQQRDGAIQTSSVAWVGSHIVFTSGYGTPIEPRKFSRSYSRHIAEARVRKIAVHDSPLYGHKKGHAHR
jgi:hypothetical protein